MKGLYGLKEKFEGCNLIIEVLDARDVEGTRLKAVEKWSGTWRLLKVANKFDLVDEETLKKLKESKYVLVNSKALHMEAEKRKFIDEILKKVKQRPIRAIIVGYPNIGKSTIINMLAGRRAARVTPIAGTTKSIQWIRISDELMILDSPGVFPRREDKGSLLEKDAINVENIDRPETYANEIAWKCIKDQVLRKWVSESFDIELGEKDNATKLIEKIARRRNLLIKGGELNIGEASILFLRKYMKEGPKRG